MSGELRVLCSSKYWYMVTQLNNLPDNMVGFKATGEVEKADFDEVIVPAVEKIIAERGKLNYMLVLDTSITNFSFGAWFEDAMIGLKHLLKWNRAAIITDVRGIQVFTKIFSALMPGEFRAFDHADMEKAISWTSTGEE